MKLAALIAAAALAAALAVPSAAGAAAIEVETTADELSDPLDGAGCSLREAVQAASSNAAFGGCDAGEPVTADTILLDPGATYPLALTGAPEDLNQRGDLDVSATGGVTIARNGTGARPTIDANDLEANVSNRDRAVDVHGAGSFTLDGVRVVDGDAGVGSGGALRWAEPGQAGDLEVTDSALAGNFAIYASAIEADTAGAHAVIDSHISAGSAADKGAIHSTGGLTVTRSEITGNLGGGIYAENGPADPLTVTATTIADNPTGIQEHVGAIKALGDADVVNSTISGNGGGFVGGIEAHGDLSVLFSTIADNYGVGGSGHDAGGIDVQSAATVALDVVLISGNRVGATTLNCNATVGADLRPSLESADTCGLETAGPSPSLVNASPELAPVAANGGPTRTRGLYPESPALDAVDGCGLGATDQRGVSRPSSDCDIGAFEGSVPRPPDPPASDPVTSAKPKPKKKPKKCKGKRKGKRKKCRARTLAAERTVIGRSVEGRAIKAVRIGDPEAERVALVVGVIHGDERAGLPIARELRRMGDAIDAQVWVIDSLNPDGARARSRRNARGVDLNRNFPHRWRGGVPRSSGYYPGPRAASEPETRAAIRLARRIEPDLSIWYHQPWGAVLACKGRPRIAARYATLVGMATSCRGRGLPGTAIGWERARIPGAEAFVVELAAGGISARSARRHASAAAKLAEEG